MTQRLTSDQLILRRHDNGAWSLHPPDAASDEPALLGGEAEAMPGGEWTRPNMRDYAVALETAAARDRKLHEVADLANQALVETKLLGAQITILKGHLVRLEARVEELGRSVDKLGQAVDRVCGESAIR